jgi:alkylhydroperoxidase family enzyme
MARISLPAPNELTDDQQEQFRRFPANLTLALLRGGGSAEAYLSLGASFAKGKLSAKDRELVILRVATLSGSSYERMQHLPIARRAGLSDEQISAVEAGDHITLGEHASAILRFVDECVYRVRVSDPVFEAVKRFVKEEEIAEISLLVGHYMMTARFLETLGIELDDAPTDWANLLTIVPE